MIGMTTFGLLIVGAIGITTLAPLILIWLLIKDWKKGDLW